MFCSKVILFCATALLAAGLTLIAKDISSGQEKYILKTGEREGFEEPGAMTRLQIYKTHFPEKMSLDSETAFTGKNSLKMDGSGGKFFMSASKMISGIEPDKKYLVGVAIKRNASKGRIALAIQEKYKDGTLKEPRFWVGEHTSKPDSTWEYFSVEYIPPSGSCEYKLILYNIKSGGTAWFDDVSVKELSPEKGSSSMACRYDGKLDWNKADTAKDFILNNPVAKSALKIPFETKMKTLYDDENIYFKFEFEEPSGYQRIARQSRKDGAVYEDDSIEIFVYPKPEQNEQSIHDQDKVFEKKKEYYQICVNSEGAIFDAVKQQGKEILDPTWSSGAVVEIEKKKNGWGGVIAVPLRNMKLSPTTTPVVGVNFCRNMISEGIIASWSFLGDSGNNNSGLSRMDFSRDTAIPPKEVSNFAREKDSGLISNPNFESSGGKEIYNWHVDGTLISQKLVTGYLPASRPLRFFIWSPNIPQVALKYLDASTAQHTEKLTMNCISKNMYEAEIKFKEKAKITEIMIDSEKIPYFAQISANQKRRFIYCTKIYDFNYRKNRDILGKDSIEVFSLYPYISILEGVPSPLNFTTAGNLSKQKIDEIKGSCQLILDLPKGVSIYSDNLYSRRWFETPEMSPSPYGKKYCRFVLKYREELFARIIGPQKIMFDAIYFSGKPENEEIKTAYYSLKINNREHMAKKLEVICYSSFPEVKKPLKKLMAGLYIYTAYSDKVTNPGTIFKDSNASKIFGNYRKIGLNTLIFNNIWCLNKIEQPGTERLIETAKHLGFEVGGLAGFFHAYHQLPADEVTVYANGDVGKNKLCPSFRGKSYSDMIDTWSEMARHGISLIDHDFEGWNFKEKEICFCARCKEKFKNFLAEKYPQVKYLDPSVFEKEPGKYEKLDSAWWEFKNQLLAEWHKDIRKAVMEKQRSTEKNHPIKIGMTKVYNCPWDWNTMVENGTLDYVGSMLYSYSLEYAEPSIDSCSKTYLNDRIFDRVDRKRHVITIAPAEVGYGLSTIPDETMMYDVLEVFGSGATGFKIWQEYDMTGGKYYWLARALNILQPVEDILYDGLFRVLKTDCESAKAHIFTHGKGTVLFVSEYSLDKVSFNVALEAQKGCNLYDLDTKKMVAGLGGKSVSISLDHYRAKMFFIGTDVQWEKINRSQE